jgi:hypothetical protein
MSRCWLSDVDLFRKHLDGIANIPLFLFVDLRLSSSE